MNRWGIIVLTLFELMLARGFLGGDFVFAAPCPVSPPCVAACASSCTYFTCNPVVTSGINQIPTTIYDNAACTGAGQYVNQMPFTDPGGTVRHTLTTPGLNVFTCTANTVTNATPCCTTDACGFCPGSAGAVCPGCGCTGDACNPGPDCFGTCGGSGNNCGGAGPCCSGTSTWDPVYLIWIPHGCFHDITYGTYYCT